MKVLVTGFDPFGGELINPSWEAVRNLPDHIEGIQIIKVLIPTVRNESIDCIKEAIETTHPDFVLSVGQAGGRKSITVERVVINVDDFRIPDNKGNQPIDIPIEEEGPDAYLLTLPIKAMVDAMNKLNIPAEISNTAGTFVCNHLAYGTAHFVKENYPHIRTGFIHIPYLPVQTNSAPTMELETVILGLETCIKTMVHFDEDIKVTGGKEH